MTDAIVRTIYRKLISHRKLLEWVTAAQTNVRLAMTSLGISALMRPAVLLAVLPLGTFNISLDWLPDQRIGFS